MREAGSQPNWSKRTMLPRPRKIKAASPYLDPVVPMSQRLHQRPDHPRLPQRGRRAPSPAPASPKNAGVLLGGPSCAGPKPRAQRGGGDDWADD